MSEPLGAASRRKALVVGIAALAVLLIGVLVVQSRSGGDGAGLGEADETDAGASASSGDGSASATIGTGAQPATSTSTGQTTATGPAPGGGGGTVPGPGATSPTAPPPTSPPPTSPPPPPPPPPPPAGGRSLAGTWVLQQVNSANQLGSASLAAALDTSGVVGFSLRVPWSAIDGNLGLLDQGLAMARERGLAYAVRFMAGRWTPERVKQAGPTYVSDGGDVIPAPFGPQGEPNAGFEEAYEAAVAALGAWSRANGVAVLHLPWWGQEWAELNHGREVRAAPGYSYGAWLAAHQRLVDRAARSVGGGGPVIEWPLSGYGPLSTYNEAGTPHRPSAEIAQHIAAVAPGAVVQANGWDADGVWGAPSQQVEADMDQALDYGLRYAFQSIQPTFTAWGAAYGLARDRGALYVEVYADSFSNGGAAELRSQVRPAAV